jgi:hypothetical protein
VSTCNSLIGTSALHALSDFFCEIRHLSSHPTFLQQKGIEQVTRRGNGEAGWGSGVFFKGNNCWCSYIFSQYKGRAWTKFRPFYVVFGVFLVTTVSLSLKIWFFIFILQTNTKTTFAEVTDLENSSHQNRFCRNGVSSVRRSEYNPQRRTSKVHKSSCWCPGYGITKI